MKLALALLALVNAQDATPEASDNTYGYEAPQETYAAPVETYAAPESFVVAPKVCVVCDEEAPCWNGATCSPKTGGYEPHYATATEGTYEPATQEAGYRSLQDSGYGAEQTFAQGEYATEAYAAPEVRFSGSCPCGTVDTKFYRVHNNVILWVAFGLLFVPALWFFYKTFENLESERDAAGLFPFGAVKVTAAIVCFVASLAYLTMALGYGFVVKCDGRNFYYARYVDWAITTPIMLYEIAKLSNRDTTTVIFLIATDIFMIVSGLIGELIEGNERWAFFGFSMFAFLPVMYILCVVYTKLGESSFGAVHPNVGSVARRIAAITLITWMGYPIIWILANVEGSKSSCGYATNFATEATQEAYRALQFAAEGVAVKKVGVISAQGEAYAYTVLDIIAKSFMGLLIVCGNYGGATAPSCPSYSD